MSSTHFSSKIKKKSVINVTATYKPAYRRSEEIRIPNISQLNLIFEYSRRHPNLVTIQSITDKLESD